MSAAHIPPNWRIAETVRPGVRIGEMILFTGTFPDEEGIAIANLIAAAPELLDALKGAVTELLAVVNSLNAEQMPHDGDDFHERLGAALAAIAKATGEQA